MSLPSVFLSTVFVFLSLGFTRQVDSLLGAVALLAAVVVALHVEVAVALLVAVAHLVAVAPLVAVAAGEDRTWSLLNPFVMVSIIIAAAAIPTSPVVPMIQHDFYSYGSYLMSQESIIIVVVVTNINSNIHRDRSFSV